MAIIKSNPQFLEQVNKAVFSTVEDLITGVTLPDIAGSKDWGDYKVMNMKVKRFVRDLA